MAQKRKGPTAGGSDQAFTIRYGARRVAAPRVSIGREIGNATSMNRRCGGILFGRQRLSAGPRWVRQEMRDYNGPTLETSSGQSARAARMVHSPDASPGECRMHHGAHSTATHQGNTARSRNTGAAAHLLAF